MPGLHLHLTFFDSILASVATLFLVLFVVFFVLFFRVKKKQRKEHQGVMKKVEKAHEDKVYELEQSIYLARKRVDALQKDYESDVQAKELMIFELNQKSKGQEQNKQIEAKHVYREIERLKQQIEVLKKGHQEKMDMTEMEVLELKKQLKALMFKA